MNFSWGAIYIAYYSYILVLGVLTQKTAWKIREIKIDQISIIYEFISIYVL